MLMDVLSRSHWKFTPLLAPLERKKPSLPVIEDESNHDAAEQKFLSEQERFIQTEIIYTLRKNGLYMPSGLGGRSCQACRQKC